MADIEVAIVLGSVTDQQFFNDTGVLGIFDEVGISYEVSIISAHRNQRKLTQYCKSRKAVQFFIAAAGMAAHLPGAIAAVLAANKTIRPVIGVPIPTPEFPDALDALLSMVRMPAGMPVAVCGIGKSGFRNAAMFVCQVLATNDVLIAGKLESYLAKTAKPALIGVATSQGENR